MKIMMVELESIVKGIIMVTYTDEESIKAVVRCRGFPFDANTAFRKGNNTVGWDRYSEQTRRHADHRIRL